jgi:tricarballylate dehydrogenase
MGNIEDLRRIIPDSSEKETKRTDFGTYNADDFFDDMGRITQYRSDPELTKAVVTRSFDTMVWMREECVRFAPMYGRQAFKISDKFRFWGIDR